MSVFFDTSVLVPVFLETHEHHEASLEAFLSAKPGRAFCAAHGLAEFYATMTRLPGAHRLSGEQVSLFLGNIREKLSVVVLGGEEYWQALAEAAEREIYGGLFYDFLLSRCAIKAHCKSLLTWNVKHFERLGPEIAKICSTP